MYKNMSQDILHGVYLVTLRRTYGGRAHGMAWVRAKHKPTMAEMLVPVNAQHLDTRNKKGVPEVKQQSPKADT